jgi:hypothetical protein
MLVTVEKTKGNFVPDESCIVFFFSSLFSQSKKRKKREEICTSECLPQKELLKHPQSSAAREKLGFVVW